MKSLRLLVPALLLAALAAPRRRARSSAGTDHHHRGSSPSGPRPREARRAAHSPAAAPSATPPMSSPPRTASTSTAPWLPRPGWRWATADHHRRLTGPPSPRSRFPRIPEPAGSYDVALLDLAAPLATTAAEGATHTPGPPRRRGHRCRGRGRGRGHGLGGQSGGRRQFDAQVGVALPLRDDTICTLQYTAHYVGERTVCAGGKGPAPSGNPDTCQGDSGGPLALDSGAGLELVGLTSYGDGCGRLGVPAALHRDLRR